MTRLLGLIVILALAAGAGTLGYRFLQSHFAADVYLEQLEELQQEHTQVLGEYNKAVTRTAVTELVVARPDVTVNVRTADGRVESHPVQANLDYPIYVDYVLVDGRLLIRRVFDSQTKPDDGTVIDSDLINIDWNDPAVKSGKAAYRQLSDGRWIITVSGDGSLSLGKVPDEVEVELIRAPEVSEFDPVAEAKAEINRIGPMEVFGRLFGRTVD